MAEVGEPEAGGAMILDPSQERAVDLICSAPFGLVTGGPGTGKTTSLRAALDRLPPASPVALAAPTGKAARRMQEATGRDASTLHRLLGYTGNGWERNEQAPLEHDLIVVDEASMVDVELASALFRAIDPKRTRLVLVGDMHQLPSVGPGRVFADLIESGAAPTARLTTLHRAAQESWVCRNAPRILEGEMPETQSEAGFEWRRAGDRNAAHEAASDAVVQAVRAGSDVQLLIPQRTGPCGTDALNVGLQARLNPHHLSGLQWGIDPHKVGRGDRVIHTVNNYALSVFNGEVGEVATIDRERLTVRFPDREVTYDREQARALRLAYALTVHKSQGSEWETVVVVCHSTHTHMLSRQLLYTAITRAKKRVVLVGDEKGLKHALKNVEPAKRNTSLVERLRAEKGEAA